MVQSATVQPTYNNKMANNINLEILFEIATSNKSGNTAFSDFAKTSNETVLFISENFNIDTKDWLHSIGESDLRHILKQHGNDEKEQKRNQRAVTKQDFLNLKEIVSNPDRIELGEVNSQGMQSVIYVKKFDDEIFCVQEIRNGRKKLVVKTMWIKKSASVV